MCSFPSDGIPIPNSSNFKFAILKLHFYDMLFKTKFPLFLYVAVFIVLIFSFLLLTYLVSNGKTIDLDTSLATKVQTISFPILTSTMIFVSTFGDGLFPLIVFLVFALGFLFEGYKKEAYFSILVWLGPALSFAAKNLIARPRPEFNLASGYPLPTDYSFPSGHAIFYSVFFGLMGFYALVMPKLKTAERAILLIISFPLILLIGSSRVYLGVHWPTDVIAGYLLGLALLELLIFAYLGFIHLPQMRDKKD